MLLTSIKSHEYNYFNSYVSNSDLPVYYISVKVPWYSFYPLPCLHEEKVSVQRWTLFYTHWVQQHADGHSPFPSGVQGLRAHIKAQPFVLQMSGEQMITKRERAGLRGQWISAWRMNIKPDQEKQETHLDSSRQEHVCFLLNNTGKQSYFHVGTNQNISFYLQETFYFYHRCC